jgi:hypothetical protein
MEGSRTKKFDGNAATLPMDEWLKHREGEARYGLVANIPDSHNDGGPHDIFFCRSDSALD